MDWQIASWCVKEGISQGAIDRFLEIPEVCVSTFGSYAVFDLYFPSIHILHDIFLLRSYVIG